MLLYFMYELLASSFTFHTGSGVPRILEWVYVILQLSCLVLRLTVCCNIMFMYSTIYLNIFDEQLPHADGQRSISESDATLPDIPSIVTFSRTVRKKTKCHCRKQ